MLVSHDSGFLDRVCTDIIHYETRKLKRYKGNLSEFVKQKPEARAYYELSAATIKFTFPEPGYLEGVKTKDKGILKMAKVGFKARPPVLRWCGRGGGRTVLADATPPAVHLQYPTSDRMIVQNVSIYCSLSTRVAIHGANGAGKSTMIKLLTGELEPLEGTVWKHPNLRMAYVAQHAFHHIEEHLDKTPNQYIQWRYALGEDREEAEKVYRQVSKEEEEKMAQSISINGVKVVVELLLGRRKLKNSCVAHIRTRCQRCSQPLSRSLTRPRVPFLPAMSTRCSGWASRRTRTCGCRGRSWRQWASARWCKRLTPRRLRGWACTRARSPRRSSRSTWRTSGWSRSSARTR